MNEVHKFHSFFTSTLNFITTLTLSYQSDCFLLGITPDLTLFAEEIYGKDDLLARYHFTLDGRILQKFDESSDTRAFTLPTDLVHPTRPLQNHPLNFHGPRLRGLREPDRIRDAVRPLEVPTRMRLIAYLGLNISPPMLLGVAESQVLAQAPLGTPDTELVCRRLRLAYALPEPRYDADHLPYDYDTLTIYAAHVYHPQSRETELSFDTVFASFPGVTLRRPMDCLTYQNHLFIADGGDAQQSSRVHVWRIEMPQ